MFYLRLRCSSARRLRRRQHKVFHLQGWRSWTSVLSWIRK